MRKLATVQTIKSFDPIPGKDKILLASFVSVGWHVIVGKDMQVGDKCIYVETDSVLPQEPKFEFLRSRCWNPSYQGFRIKAMKMGGVYSEGIVFPLTIIPDTSHAHCLEDGYDVTDLLGIVKYDMEAKEEQKEEKKRSKLFLFLVKIPFIKALLFKKNDKGWPKWASKSDETRVQNLQYVFDNYKNLSIVVTEKVDGQSALYGLRYGRFYVCSRNMQIMIPKGKYKKEKSNYIKTAIKYDIKNKLKKARKLYGHDFYVQGEQCGPGIQGNKYGFADLTFFVFNVYDITSKCYLSPNNMKNFCIELGFQSVPYLEHKPFDWEGVDALVEYAKGNSKFSETPREGIVIRSEKWMPPDVLMSNQWSFKVINPDFTMKYGL